MPTVRTATRTRRRRVGHHHERHERVPSVCLCRKAIPWGCEADSILASRTLLSSVALLILVAMTIPTVQVLAPVDDAWNEPDAIVVLGGSAKSEPTSASNSPGPQDLHSHYPRPPRIP
jgi:hypothetical protein